MTRRTLQELVDTAHTVAELDALSMTPEFAALVEQGQDEFEPMPTDFAIGALRAAAHRDAMS